MACFFKNRNNIIYTEKLIQINKDFPMFSYNASKTVFKNYIFMPLV